MLEHLQLFVDVRLGDQGVKDVEHTVDIPDVMVLLEQLDFIDDICWGVLALFD